MAHLNYNHLRYFWATAHEGNLTQAAAKLNVSQSALSVQIKSLEEQIGHALFERKRRGLQLTEAGRIALDYADIVFKTGSELLGKLQGESLAARQVLKIGAITTLSRNFQLSLLRPLLGSDDIQLIVRSGSLRELLSQLDAHAIDIVLTNQPVPRDANTQWHSHLLREQPVSLVGPKPRGKKGKFKFPQDLSDTPIILPSFESEIRVAFERLLELAGVRPIIYAEVDDMAMLRLLARESGILTLVPPIVVRDELNSGSLVERYKIPNISERFYAITQTRRFPNPLVKKVLTQAIDKRG